MYEKPTSQERRDDKLSLKDLDDFKPRKITDDLYVFREQQPQIERLDNPTDNPVEGVGNAPYFNVNSIPFTGIGYSIDDGQSVKILELYKAHRLSKIQQFGYLNDPEVQQNNTLLPETYTHTRLLHSLDVMTLATLITRNNWREVLKDANGDPSKIIRVAALTHDVLTPAGGDTIKRIDPEAFDEDRGYGELLARKEIRGFCKSQFIDSELLYKTVLGEGMLGSILDIADKIAYTGRDASRFIDDAKQIFPWYEDTDARNQVIDHLQKYPLVCSVWDSVSIEDQVVILDDTERFINLLELRMLLFRNLYTHPKARFNEAVVIPMVQFLYETDRLTREELVDMTDWELTGLLEKEMYFDLNSFTQQDKKPRYEAFDSTEEARAYERGLVAKGQNFVMFDDVRGELETGSHFRIRKNNTTQTLKEAYPEVEQHLLELGVPIDPIRVYSFEDEPKIPHRKADEFREWRLNHATL